MDIGIGFRPHSSAHETKAAPAEYVAPRAHALTARTYALILAGGRGTRLNALTDGRAKPAVPFGGMFRIIDFPLSNCVNSGIRRIGIATQYKAQSLIRHVQRGWSFLAGQFGEFVELMPAQQMLDDAWYRGTADAAYQNLDSLRAADPELVLVLAGDHVYKMDYARFLAHHVAKGADMTVGCIDVPIDEARAFGVMGADASGRVTSFVEKPADPPPMPGRPDRALASMGIYVFNARFLYEQLVRDASDPRSGHDFGRDIIPALIGRVRVYLLPFRDACVGGAPGNADEAPYWRDVGTVDAYWEANMELARVTPALNLYDQTWPIWTYQEQLPPAKFVLDEEGRRGGAVDSLVSGGCIVSGGTVRRSVLFSNVRVAEHSVVEDSVVLPGARIARNVVLRRAIVEEGCVIPEGVSVGVDPARDAQRFHVSAGGVTLVTPEMLGQPHSAVV